MAKSISYVMCIICVSCVTSELLMLTPLIEQGRIVEAQKASEINYQGTSFGYAGHFTVPAQHNTSRLNNIWTWYQPCSDGCDEATAPLLVWLQGGPGGPGWFGAFAELGNWYITGSGNDTMAAPRCFSWCKTNNCLFVDQPVQTGFSFQTEVNTGNIVTAIDEVDYTDTAKAAMQQVFSVFQQFRTMFPKTRTAPLVITGESYGGLYTPNLGWIVAEHNRQAAAADKIIFQGLAVGDPAIDWKTQMPTYPDTLYGMGVLMSDERTELANIMAKSLHYLEQGDCPRAFDTWNAVWDDNAGLGPIEGRGWFANTTGSTNTANILMGKPPSSWELIGSFLAKQEVMSAFHVDGIPAPTHGDAAALGVKVYDAFVQSGDWCQNSSFLYAELLIHTEIDLMIYSSTVDPILGPPTTEAGILSIMQEAEARSSDKGKRISAAFGAAKKKLWFVDSVNDEQPAGYAKCIPNGDQGYRFCYTVIRNAGHEAPGYQPRAGYDMIDRFVSHRAWDTSGDRAVPQCAQCDGAGPFAGKSLPACSK